MPSVLTLDKSLLLLEAIFSSGQGVGTRALAKRYGMNVATVHNIVRTFSARGYLRQDPVSKLFFPGIRLMLLGRHPSYLHSLAASAEAVLEKVSAELDESILLGSVDQGRIVSLKYIASRQALRVQEPEDISELSHCTAFGKVLLASLSEEELESHLKKLRFHRFTKNTLDTPEKLRKALKEIRRTGYARACDEHSEGISAVAVPIFDPWGKVIASIGASAPTVRMQKAPHFQKNLQTLKKAASEIEAIWSRTLQQGAKKN